MTDRKKLHRERMEKHGLKRFDTYLHPDDFDEMHRLANKLRKKAGIALQKKGRPHKLAT